MFHPFDVVVNDAFIEAKKAEEIGEELVPSRDVASQRFPGGREDEAAVLLVFQKAVGIKALDHVGDAGLGNLQTGGDIDDPGVALGIDELEDPLEIILDRGGIALGLFGGGHGRQVNGLSMQVKIKVFGR